MSILPTINADFVERPLDLHTAASADRFVQTVGHITPGEDTGNGCDHQIP